MDYFSPDRDRVKEFLLKDKLDLPQIQTSEIITFNTIAEKGAIRDVARAMGIPLDEVAQIIRAAEAGNRPEKYKELFEYVDIVNGTIVSVGSHPSGVLVGDYDIDSEIGTCTIGGSKYKVSMLNMKELDATGRIKLDILG